MRLLISNLRTLLATNMAATSIRTYMSGPVELVAKSDLPSLNIIGNSTQINLEGTVRYKNIFEITIEVYIDLRQFFDTTIGQGTQIDALDRLYELMEDRDADGDLQTDTVVGTLMNNLTVSTQVLFLDNIKINYEKVEAFDFPAYKASVTFLAEDRYNNT